MRARGRTRLPRTPSGFALLRSACLVHAAIAGLTARAQAVTATVPTAPNPYAMAVNTVTNKVYVVSNSGSGSVTVVDGATNAASTVPVGASPMAIDVNMVTNRIYVANSASNNVTVIDGATNATTTVAVGTDPIAIAVNSATNKVYVVNGAYDGSDLNGSITVIDGASNATATIAIGVSPGAIAVNPVTDNIYVCGGIAGGEATVIDGTTNATLPIDPTASSLFGAIPPNSVAVVVNTVTNMIYIANQSYTGVTVINGATNAVSTAGSNDSFIAIAANMATNRIYAVSQAYTHVMVIDGATNATSFVATGPSPSAVAVNPATDKVYATILAASGSLLVIDGATNSASAVAVGAYPFAVAVNPMTNRIYVLGNDSSGTLTVIDGTTVSSAPSFTSEPVSQTVNAGASVVFNAAAGGMPSPAYKWSFNGAPLSDGGGISGSSGPILYMSGASPANSGTYTCAATNSAGSATSTAATLTVAGSADPGRIINLSTRAYSGAGSNVLIAGFLVSGAGKNPLILRGVGPSLAGFGISDWSADPEVLLFDTASPANLITMDSGWQNPPSAPGGAWSGRVTPVDATGPDFAQVGAFALIPGSGDSAVKVALPAGTYTAQVGGGTGFPGDPSGLALAEVYLADAGSPASQLVNISSRAYVVPGSSILIAGFVISGSTSESVLIRASGPALAPFGVVNPLPDPQLQLFDANQRLVASNAGWAGLPQIAAAASKVGAFPWDDPSSADSAILVTLPPGAYTAQITPLAGDQGNALVEVYAVP
jgi:YVTN family beta-propeller protein